MTPFNINGYASVQLTPDGLAMFRKWHADLGLKADHAEGELKRARHRATKAYNLVGDRWHTFQLHEVMHVFGPECFNGSTKPPFETEIIIHA